MLDLDAGTIRHTASLRNQWDNRLPWLLQCIGPRDGSSAIRDNPYLWEGRVLGVGARSITSAVVKLQNTITGGVVYFYEIPPDAAVLSVSIAFDVNGRLACTYFAENTGAHLVYYDDASEQYTTLHLGEGARSPCIALDRFVGAFGDRDLIVSYLVGTELRVRYQRQRYSEEHVVVDDLSPDIELRTTGTSYDGRFTWRFKHRVRRG